MSDRASGGRLTGSAWGAPQVGGGGKATASLSCSQPFAGTFDLAVALAPEPFVEPPARLPARSGSAAVNLTTRCQKVRKLSASLRTIDHSGRSPAGPPCLRLRFVSIWVGSLTSPDRVVCATFFRWILCRALARSTAAR